MADQQRAHCNGGLLKDVQIPQEFSFARASDRDALAQTKTNANVRLHSVRRRPALSGLDLPSREGMQARPQIRARNPCALLQAGL